MHAGGSVHSAHHEALHPSCRARHPLPVGRWAACDDNGFLLTHAHSYCAPFHALMPHFAGLVLMECKGGSALPDSFLHRPATEAELQSLILALQEEMPQSPWALTFSYGRALQGLNCVYNSLHPSSTNLEQAAGPTLYVSIASKSLLLKRRRPQTQFHQLLPTSPVNVASFPQNAAGHHTYLMAFVVGVFPGVHPTSHVYVAHKFAAAFAAVQSTTLKTWSGKPENVAAAQDILVKLAAANSAAQRQLTVAQHMGRFIEGICLGCPFTSNQSFFSRTAVIFVTHKSGSICDSAEFASWVYKDRLQSTSNEPKLWLSSSAGERMGSACN
eukprot:1159525-Pelagomonas_calceolata.AAC.4